MPSVPHNAVVCLCSVGAFVVQAVQVGRVTPGGKVKQNRNEAAGRKAASICVIVAVRVKNFAMLVTAQFDSCKNSHLWTSVRPNNHSLTRAQLQVLLASLKQKFFLFFPPHFWLDQLSEFRLLICSSWELLQSCSGHGWQQGTHQAKLCARNTVLLFVLPEQPLLRSALTPHGVSYDGTWTPPSVSLFNWELIFTNRWNLTAN